MLLQILIPARFNCLFCKKGNSLLSHVLEKGLLGKDLVITLKMKKGGNS